MRITEIQANREFLLGAAAGGAFILLISVYELAGLWSAVVALGVILIFFGLWRNRTKRQREAVAHELKRFEEDHKLTK